jgi:hypothetical protein
MEQVYQLSRNLSTVAAIIRLNPAPIFLSKQAQNKKAATSSLLIIGSVGSFSPI